MFLQGPPGEQGSRGEAGAKGDKVRDNKLKNSQQILVQATEQNSICSLRLQ